MLKYILPLILFFSQSSYALRTMTIPLVTNGDMSTAEVDSAAIDFNQVLNASVSAIYTGSPVGTIELQWSNAVVANASLVPSSSWIVYTGSAQAVSGAGVFGWNLLDAGYRWIRLAYFKASGTGTLNATMTTKGN